MGSRNCCSKTAQTPFLLEIALTHTWLRQTNKLLRLLLLCRGSLLLMITQSSVFDYQHLAAAYPLNSYRSSKAALSFAQIASALWLSVICQVLLCIWHYIYIYIYLILRHVKGEIVRVYTDDVFCSNMFCTIDSYTRVAPVAFFCIHQTAPLVWQSLDVSVIHQHHLLYI